MQYNLDHDHLQAHGLHPRATHALVNLPLLFGPLVVLWVVRTVRTVRSRGPQDVWLAVALVVPLLLLSVAPHQEPRFLLPLLLPLHLAAGRDLFGRTKRKANLLLLLVWLAFNAGVGLFFGLLHQGGVVPLLLDLADHPASTTSRCRWQQQPNVDVDVASATLVFYQTYMPPRFLLARLAAKPSFRAGRRAGAPSSHDARRAGRRARAARGRRRGGRRAPQPAHAGAAGALPAARGDRTPAVA